MRDRQELFSEKMVTPKRIYYFDVRESSNGAKCLVVSESRRHGEDTKRDRIMVFEENLDEFCDAFQKTLDFIRSQAK
ncbi:MAG: DUF3276 family protein [Candidatus Caenarcaniphilales bacterium]|nr:DUF3276 family protein [Candidatus Caenarcaniphilales bacterium]